MTTEESYHRWLIKHRIYCEYDQCFKRATKVRKVIGRDTCYCDWHGKSLDSLRANRKPNLESTTLHEHQ